jgi:hypothetical protein
MPAPRLALFVLLAAAALAPARASAWADTGHRLVTRVGLERLPADLPAFLRTPEAIETMTELGREMDRSRSAGQPHDANLDPGHFLDLDDERRVMGGPPLYDLPATRAAYEKALQAAGTDSWKAGYLPYAILEGWQQLVKDFGYWRVLRVGEALSPRPEDRAWFAADRRRREALIVRDLGVWSHYVADASQPLHVTVHYNGWGDGPNPFGMTQEKIHAPFEGEFVRSNVTLDAVRAAVPAPDPCTGQVRECVLDYLAETYRYVLPLYRRWGEGEFRRRDPEAVAFATERVAAGAGALRDLVARAWQESATASVGYPSITVRSVEQDGSPPPIGAIRGYD